MVKTGGASFWKSSLRISAFLCVSAMNVERKSNNRKVAEARRDTQS